MNRQKRFPRRSMCINDAYHDYIQDKIMSQDYIYFDIQIEIGDESDGIHKYLCMK